MFIKDDVRPITRFICSICKWKISQPNIETHNKICMEEHKYGL